jgi:hypothetical protein
MAGSLKFFKYTTTGGTEYAIKMDESNGEAIGNTDLVAADGDLAGLPRNITARYVLYRSADGLTNRRIPVTANNVDLAALPATITVASPIVAAAGIVLLRQSFVGEVQRPVVPVDTAQLDGDAD